MTVTLAMAACCAAVGWSTCAVALQRYVATWTEEAGQHTTFHAQNLYNTPARYESLPRLAVLEYVSHVALQENPHVGDVTTRRAANAYLKEVRAVINLAAAHLINAIGLTIVASSWDLLIPFVDQNYAFRPYSVETIRERLGRSYDVSNTAGETDYFVVASMREGNRSIGVVVAKVNLDAFRVTLLRSGDAVLLVDRHGVIFLLSVSEWKYHALGALNVDQRAALGAMHQYAPYVLAPLGMNDGRAANMPFPADHPPQTVRVVLPRKLVSALRMQYCPVGLLGWQVAVLIDPRDGQRAALVAGASVVFAMAFIFAVLVALHLRQRRREEQHRAHAALREVQRDLEVRIAQRTVELASVNTVLTGRVEAFGAAQRILRRTRDAAVQVGKFAVLSRMAASITHELNQSLAALTTLSDNANQFAKCGRIDEICDDLTHISRLAEHMGRIISHIKTFSRKGDAACTAASVDEAIRQTLMLAETCRRRAGVTVIADPVPADLAVRIDAVWFKQVLANPTRNATDATVEAPVAESPTVRVNVEPVEKWIRITVHGFDPSILANVLPRLFEPFFTTKDSGQGLGLGLAVSLTIIEDFGDRFKGRNTGDGVGGAEFIIELECVVRPT